MGFIYTNADKIKKEVYNMNLSFEMLMDYILDYLLKEREIIPTEGLANKIKRHFISSIVYLNCILRFLFSNPFIKDLIPTSYI